jgi:chemotaxis protein methyltransferase CheR
MRAWGTLLPKARSLIASRLGLEFSEGRQADLERGLIHACQAASISDPEAYLAWLATLPEESPEWRRLASHLTVGETYFFRDRACFEALEQHVLPSLVAARRSEAVLRLRLWSAGCATGEEPYSLAILLDRVLPDRADWALTILATDINLEALEAVERGCYRAWALRETPPWIRERYFHRRGAETFELDPTIRRMVAFAPLNLAEEGYPMAVTNTSAMDLILCRSVLMYFTPEAQRATVARLQQALAAGGWLVVSPAEASADLFRPLVPVNFPGGIFYRKEMAGGQGLGAGDWGKEIANPRAVIPDAFLPASVVEGKDVKDQEPGFEPHGAGGRISVHGGAVAGEIVHVPAPEPHPPIPSYQPPFPIPQLPLLERARALADQGSLEAARCLCEDVLARDQLDIEAYLLLAAICQEQGDLRATMEALRRVIYLDPDSAAAHFLMGSIVARQGEWNRARRYLTTAVHLLGSIPHDEAVPGGEGLTAGRLLETARMCLDMVANEGRGARADSRLSFPVGKGEH